jgi:hypothetical protein
MGSQFFRLIPATLEEMVDHYDLRKYFTHIVGLDNITQQATSHRKILMNVLATVKEKAFNRRYNS